MKLDEIEKAIDAGLDAAKNGKYQVALTKDLVMEVTYRPAFFGEDTPYEGARSHPPAYWVAFTEPVTWRYTQGPEMILFDPRNRRQGKRQVLAIERCDRCGHLIMDWLSEDNSNWESKHREHVHRCHFKQFHYEEDALGPFRKELKDYIDQKVNHA